MASNHITKVAIVGAGGNVGSFIASALLKTGTHTVTALTRTDSTGKLPEGVIPKPVDYDKPETLVEALQGQEALIITMGAHGLNNEVKLIKAAGEAGVQWILPNEWSPWSVDDEHIQDLFFYQAKLSSRKALESLEKTSYIAVLTGFWYEWSLAIPAAFGFDFANRSITFFDEGEAKVSISTWPQVGRAVAALLSLPIINADNGDARASLETFKNKEIYINSFTVSQKDIFQSVLRVTATKPEDWTITKEPARERVLAGAREIQEGKNSGFAKKLYARVFYDDGFGDFEHNKGTVNGLLGLPVDDIDEATKVAVERSKGPQWGQ